MNRVRTPDSRCWVTLITRPSYLPGVVILAHSLDQANSEHPLVVQYTSTLGGESIAALQEESVQHGRIILNPVELLLPRCGHENVSSVAERFKDTFTKLRAFEVYQLGFTEACFLDADMAVYQNPDGVFDNFLPGRDWIGATHACVCNLDNDKWAPSSWRKGNCAYTTLTNPGQVFGAISENTRSTYRLLNGGLFLFHPTKDLWEKILAHFETSNRLRDYKLPDQDFLADFFRGKWQPISWKFNALKTLRYWHPNLWSDKEVVILHYIVDKPWERKLGPDGVAGHLGRDGPTHKQWWKLYDEWLSTQPKPNKIVLDTVSKLVDTQQPFTTVIPLPQEPGKPEDVVAAGEI